MGPLIPERENLSLLGLMAKIKCSICSYQFNIWYAGHRPAHILIWFLAFGQGSEACLTLTTGCLGIALQPSAAHYSIKKFDHITLTCHVSHQRLVRSCYRPTSPAPPPIQAKLLSWSPNFVSYELISDLPCNITMENVNESTASIFVSIFNRERRSL